jgi:type I restriction enzyme, S subunit
MTARLPENLDLIATAPDGIRKLRGLILELAVRGKLVPQDPNDEPASELLKHVDAERRQLKLPPRLPADDAAGPFSLPEEWLWLRFGDVAQHNSGKTLDKGRNTGNTRRYITTSNLYWGRFDLANVREMLIRDEELERCTARRNDLLICEGGEAGRAAVWDTDEEICFQNHVHRARFFAGINPYYAYRTFQRLDLSGEINEFRKGVGISNLSGKALASIPFPLPPLAEQHRIVAKVDEMMALCDRLEAEQADAGTAHSRLVATLLGTLTQSADAAELAANWQRLAEHFDSLFTTEASLDTLKQTILQLAVMGKLVPQDPNDEPANELLKRIAKERARLEAKGVCKMSKPVPPVDGDTLYQLPTKWQWSPLDPLVRVMDSGWSPACVETPSSSDDVWGVLKTTAVQTFKYFEYENKELPSHLAPRPECEVAAGDILITRAGPKNRVAISCLVEATRPRLMISDKIIRFHLVDGGMFEKFVALCLNAGGTAAYLEAAKSGMAASQMNITQDKLRAAPVPICSSAEQHRIVSKVDELMALCDRLKADLAESRTQQERLAATLIESALQAA